MIKFTTLLVALLVTIGTMGFLSRAGAGTKDEEVIKKVMKEAMKGGLYKKVMDGKANDDEKQTLLKLYQSLAKEAPPEGDEASWKTKTTALVTAAQAAVDGKGDSSALIKSAANCKACHSVHKPK